MAEKIRINDASASQRLLCIENWKVPETTRKEIILFITELGLGKVNKGKRLCDNAQLKYINSLKTSLEYFNKPTDQISGNDIEEFEKGLISDSVKSRFKDRPYQHSTKIGIRKALKVFLRWKLGEARATELAGWVDTRRRETTPNYLTEEEVAKLFFNCHTIEQRFAIAVLFDSGAGAEEFINIRLEDLQMPDSKISFVRIVLKQEYSKTKGRTVSLYWKESLDIIKEYLEARFAEGIKPDEPVYKNTYPALRMFLNRLGKRVLKKSVHPHLFRHSSATYYASKLNRQELCYRYGWRFSSNMPDIYISRAGMESKQLDEKFAQTEMSGLQGELTKVQLAAKIKDDRILDLEKKIQTIVDNLSLIKKMKARGVTADMVEEALKRKRL